MTITDKAVINLLEKHRLYKLDSMLEDYPEDEIDGRSDMDMFKHELEWLIERLNGDWSALHEDLVWAKEVLQRTKYGRVMPLYLDTLLPVYKPSDITCAKEIVNEYNRTISMGKRMKLDFERR